MISYIPFGNAYYKSFVPTTYFRFAISEKKINGDLDNSNDHYKSINADLHIKIAIIHSCVSINHSAVT